MLDRRHDVEHGSFSTRSGNRWPGARRARAHAGEKKRVPQPFLLTMS
jgi:hypothetical protein